MCLYCIDLILLGLLIVVRVRDGGVHDWFEILSEVIIIVLADFRIISELGSLLIGGYW
jgi:hypothetical protein